MVIAQNADQLDETDISVSDSLDDAAWQVYVTRKGGSVYHRKEWTQVLRVYGLELICLGVLRHDEVVGVLPLVEQSSLLFGRRLVSLPWFDAAGLIVDDAQARQQLLAAAIRVSKKCRVKEIQFRQPAPIDGWSSPRTDKILMRLSLPSDADQLWDGFSPKVRNQVRKAEKHGLTHECGGADCLDEFHRIYRHNMRDLGSPAHSPNFFRAVLEAFPDEARVHVIWADRRPVAAGLTLDNGSNLEIPWASSLRRFNSYCVNHLLYWRILQEACRRGFECFHFGRSTEGSGTYRFKKQWGAKPVTLFWYSFDAQGVAQEPKGRPEEAFGLARRTWRYLPVWIADILGPAIISRVP